MAQPTRMDIARTTGELSLHTKEGVAERLGVEIGSEQFEKAFGKAVERGLVEPSATDATAGMERWTLSEKGKRKLASHGGPE